MSQRDKMIAGELYDAFAPELVAARTRAHDLCLALNVTSDDDAHARRHILRDLLGAGGDTAIIQPPFFCDHGANIELGERVYFNAGCTVLDVCRVRIGAFTLLGAGSVVTRDIPDGVLAVGNPCQVVRTIETPAR